MPTPTIQSQPNDIELANGDVVVSLYDTLQEGGQLGVQVIVGATVISTLRQFPNLVGYQHFNINKILQSQLELQTNPEGSPSLPLYNANGTIFDYRISYGYIDTGGAYVSTATLANLFTSINGNKKYYQTDWDITDGPGRYIPNVTNVIGFNVIAVANRQLALTNRNITDTRLIGDITDGTPTWSSAADKVRDIYINEGDYYSLAFYNGWEGSPLASYNGINFLNLAMFEADGTAIGETVVDNLTSQGGGPNVTELDETNPSGNTRIINFKCGYNNSDVAGAADLSHFYVAAAAFNTTPGSAGRVETSLIYRFNILPCQGKDYPIIDVAWINDFGQYDYFSFQKRNVETNTIERTEYNAVPDTWSSTGVNVNTWDRGRGTFATKVEENYTAATRYIDEYDSEYLKYLYRSPGVMVRFEGDTTWTPVVLTSNSWDEKTPQNQGKRLFQHEISFKTAWNPQIQNG